MDEIMVKQTTISHNGSGYDYHTQRHLFWHQDKAADLDQPHTHSDLPF